MKVITYKTRLVTYKTLIRPIIDYVPFSVLIMANSNIEKIQRKAIRYALNLCMDTNLNVLYEKSKLEKMKMKLFMI